MLYKDLIGIRMDTLNGKAFTKYQQYCIQYNQAITEIK